MRTFSHTFKNYCFVVFCCLISLPIFAQEPVKEGQWYVIQSYKKQLVLQTQQPFQNNGVAVILGRYNTKDHSLFKFEAVGNGYYIIRSKQSNKVIDIRGGSQKNGAVVQMWNQANVENQKFKLGRATGDGYYYITAKHSNKSIAAAAGFNMGSTVIQKYGDGLSNAMFKLIPYTPKKPKPQPKPKPQSVTKSIQPKLIAPVTGQVVENRKGNSIKFQWEKVPNATQYQLFVEHSNKKDKLLNSYFKENYYNLELSEVLPAKLAKGAWGWWVRAKIGNEWTKWSKPNTIYFKQATPTRPTVMLNSPQQNATLANGKENNSATYIWDFDWADVPKSEQYEILVSHPNDAGKSFRKTTPVSKYQLIQRNHRKTNELIGWTWKVRVFSNGYYGNWSTPRTFNVERPKKQNTPVNPTPVVTDDLLTQNKNNFSKIWKNKHFAKISNKVSTKNTLSGYDMNSKKFAMNATNTDWRVRSLGGNTYQLQVYINGKFWSLAAANDRKGNVLLANNNRYDKFQQWEITQQADGYYRITNIGMRLEQYEIDDTLFYDSKNNDFFVSKWKEGKTANGRWYFDAKQPIKNLSDPLENRTFSMSSAVNGKKVCIAFVWTSDATGYNKLDFCRDNENSFFKFEKTVRGTYLIKIKKSANNYDEWNYLADDLAQHEIERYKNAAITKEYGFEWTIIQRGNGQYTFVGVDSQKAIELVQRASRNPREVIELKTRANKRTQYFKLN
ncbi:ricin-type beta-trefoil lectin domain-like protein [Kordia sp. SMS9]|uniref:RICIN domain-containing protein n=1 Tax=Kordia sp. SMS9 TaxID=2282170 RepID=UPI000E0E0154|nr:RICIN domain-containing protein [Kordia sp. SMS9]AXG70390.1 ricin-type beta-trefoil lectin domain-like protein [Kordia sp. SMS9]